MTVHELTRTEARRIAVQAQLLDNNRPTDLMETVRRLTVLQFDQTAAVAPNADLVTWSRLGSSRLARDELADALAEQRVIELRGMIRPAEDIALYRAEMAAFPGTWRIAANNVGLGVREIRNSLLKGSYLAECRKYAPALQKSDLLPAVAGIRAQAVLRDGTLIHDFVVAETARMIHVLNSPSPAATAALPIGEHLAGLAVIG